MAKQTASSKIAAQVRLNSVELKDLLKYVYNNNLALQTDGKTPIALNIVGPAGTSKTSCVEQVAEEMNVNFVKLSVSQIEDPSDLIGFPYKEYLFKREKDSDEVWVNEHSIPEFLAIGYKPLNHSRMGYAAPKWIVGKKEGGILLLDDSQRANLNILQACMDILDRQEYISWKLPKGWTVVTTNNPDDGQYLVTSVDAAHKTRQINIEMKFEVGVWAEWAEKDGVDGRCINFLLKHPELIENCTDGSINARSFTKFFYSLKTIGDFEANLSRVQILAEGSIGEDAALIFTQFIHGKLDRLPTPKQMIEEKDEEKMLKQLRNLTKVSTDDARADIAHILSIRLQNYCLHYAENNPVSDEMQARVAAILEDEKVFTVDIRQLVLRKLGTHTKYKKILTNKLIKHFINDK